MNILFLKKTDQEEIKFWKQFCLRHTTLSDEKIKASTPTNPQHPPDIHAFDLNCKLKHTEHFKFRIFLVIAINSPSRIQIVLGFFEI